MDTKDRLKHYSDLVDAAEKFRKEQSAADPNFAKLIELRDSLVPAFKEALREIKNEA
jgi:hypothetical protein